ncbi:MAG: hypothetical protein AB7K63_17350 [Vicinamibacterales bacterium]
MSPRRQAAALLIFAFALAYLAGEPPAHVGVLDLLGVLIPSPGF